jgi:hypothetical protein
MPSHLMMQIKYMPKTVALTVTLLNPHPLSPLLRLCPHQNLPSTGPEISSQFLEKYKLTLQNYAAVSLHPAAQRLAFLIPSDFSYVEAQALESPL